MSLVYVKNKKTGSTYVYEQEPFYDSSFKQSRPKRTYLGVLDESTGEIKKLGRGKNKKSKSGYVAPFTQTSSVDQSQELLSEIDHLKKIINDKDELIRNQQIRISQLEQLLATTLTKLKDIESSLS